LRVKRPLATGQPLHEQTRRFVDQNGHTCLICGHSVGDHARPRAYAWVPPCFTERSSSCRKTSYARSCGCPPALRGGGPSLPGQLYDPLRRFVHRVGGREIHPALLEQALPFLDVRPFHADDDRHPHAQLLHGADHALREHVAAQDAAEDVDEDGPHVPVRREDLERIADLFRVGAATRSEEHTSELQSLAYLVCRLLLEKKN